jgi:uncharacterized RDD family membrane protein YckC
MPISKEYLPTKKDIICPKCGRLNGVWSDSPPDARVCAGCGVSLVISGPVSGDRVGFGLRYSAFGMDIFLIASVVFVMGLMFSRGTLFTMTVRDGFYTALWLLFFLTSPIYFWLCTGLKGQTAGKRFLGIRVTTEDGNKLGLGTAFLREILFKPISFLVAPWFFLLYIFSSAVTTNTTEGVGLISKSFKFHEIATHTKVVEVGSYRRVSETGGVWWLLIVIGPAGSILGLLLLWKKDRRKAWSILWSGLITSIVVIPAVVIVIGITFS